MDSTVSLITAALLFWIHVTGQHCTILSILHALRSLRRLHENMKQTASQPKPHKKKLSRFRRSQQAFTLTHWTHYTRDLYLFSKKKNQKSDCCQNLVPAGFAYVPWEHIDRTGDLMWFACRVDRVDRTSIRRSEVNGPPRSNPGGGGSAAASLCHKP